MIYLLTNKNIIIPTVPTNIQTKKPQFSRPRKRHGSFTDWIHQIQPVFLGVAHLSLCIITYCSISTVKLLVRLASFFFYVFFYLLVLHLPLTLCNHPQIFSIIQQNHSSSHPSLVNTNKLSLGCPLATNFAICACTIAWRCGCCGKPSAGFHHLVWLWHFELSVDGTGADCLREKNEKSGKAVEIFGSSIHIVF